MESAPRYPSIASLPAHAEIAVCLKPGRSEVLLFEPARAAAKLKHAGLVQIYDICGERRQVLL